MGFFDSLFGGDTRTCPECGGTMRFVDDEVMMCDKCKWSCEYEDLDGNEKYEDLYPTREEVTGEYEEDNEEEHEGLYDDFMPFED